MSRVSIKIEHVLVDRDQKKEMSLPKGRLQWLIAAIVTLVPVLLAAGLFYYGSSVNRYCRTNVDTLDQLSGCVTELHAANTKPKAPADVNYTGQLVKLCIPMELTISVADYDAVANTVAARLETKLADSMPAGTGLYLEQIGMGQYCDTETCVYYTVAEPAQKGDRNLILAGPLKMDPNYMQDTHTYRATHHIHTSTVAYRQGATMLRLVHDPDVSAPDVTHLPLWLKNTPVLTSTIIVNETLKHALVYAPAGTSFAGAKSWVELPAKESDAIHSMHVTFDGDVYHFT